MNAETLNDLKERADEIKEATEAGENTAVRVGGLLRDMLDYDQDQTDAISNLSSNVLQQPLSGINQMNSSPSEGQSIRFRNNRWEFFVPGEGGGSSSGRQSSYFMNVTHGTTPSLPDPQDYVPANDKFVHGNDEWTSSSPNPGYNEDTWMIWVWFSNGVPLTINGPILVRDSSTASSNGEDGESIEWIYKRVSEKYTDAEILTLQEFLEDCYGSGYTSPDARPSGWEDHPSGIDSTNKYEYTAYRKSSLDAQGNRIWGETGFVGPILWAAYGDKGTDGDGVEYIYYANNLGYIPMGDDYDPTAWTNDEHFQDPEYIRTVEGTAIQYWKDDPIDLANSDLGQGAIEWVSVRKKQTINGVTSWQPYSVPAVWSRLAVDGLVEGYTVDLSNQNMPVGTTFEGHAANYGNTCQVTVYHNGVPMNYGTDVGEFTLSIGTITRSDGVAVNGRITANQNFPSNPNDIIVQIDSTGIDDFDSKNAFVPVTVTIYEGLNQTTTRNLTITLFGVAVGEAGKVIDLYTETAAIHTNASGTVIAPAALEVGVRVGTGSDYQIKSVNTARSEGYTFYYYYDSQQSVNELTTNSLAPENNHTNLHIILLKNNVRIDEERLPYVKDGDKGDSLTNTTPYYHADASSSFNTSGAIDPSIWYPTIQAAGWNAINKYLYIQELNTYSWGGTDWTPVSLFRTWINDGQASFKSIVFKRASSRPNAPTGGTFNSPYPTTSGWSDGIPSGTESIWASTRIFTSDGLSPQQSSWTTPEKQADTFEYDVEFSAIENNPGNPTSNPNNWHDPTNEPSFDFSTAIWRAERYYRNGAWSSWVIEKIKGERADVVEATSTVKTVNIECNNNGNAVSGTTINGSVGLKVNGTDLSQNNLTITVVSKPTGITFTNPVDYPPIYYGYKISYLTNASRSTLEGDIVLRVEDNTNYSAEVVIPVICSNNGKNGDNGIDAATVKLSQSVILYEANSSGYATSSQSTNITYSLWVKNVDISSYLTSVTVSCPNGVTLSNKTNSGCTLTVINFMAVIGTVTITMTAVKDNISYTAYGYIQVSPSRNGTPGNRGKVGRFFYYAGEFDVNDGSHLFDVNDAQAPYFKYDNNGTIEYWVYNPETNPSGGKTTMSAMGTPSSSSANWQKMTSEFDYLITKAIFGDYAEFGSAIINQDWLMSANGTLGYEEVTKDTVINTKPAYTYFNPLFPYDNCDATILEQLVTSTTDTNATQLTPEFTLDQYNVYTIYVTGRLEKINSSGSAVGGTGVVRLCYGDASQEGVNNMGIASFTSTSDTTLSATVTLPSKIEDCRLVFCKDGTSDNPTNNNTRFAISGVNIRCSNPPFTKTLGATASSKTTIVDNLLLRYGKLYTIEVDVAAGSVTSYIYLYSGNTLIRNSSKTGSGTITLTYNHNSNSSLKSFSLKAYNSSGSEKTNAVRAVRLYTTIDNVKYESPYVFTPHYVVDLKSGMTYQDDCVVAGLLKKKEVVINTSNRKYYSIQRNGYYNYLLFDRVGGIINIRGGIRYIELPLKRQYYGNKIAIKVTTNSSVYIYPVYYDGTNYDSSEPFGIYYEEICYLELKAGVLNGAEYLYWEVLYKTAINSEYDN